MSSARIVEALYPNVDPSDHDQPITYPSFEPAAPVANVVTDELEEVRQSVIALINQSEQKYIDITCALPRAAINPLTDLPRDKGLLDLDDFINYARRLMRIMNQIHLHSEVDIAAGERFLIKLRTLIQCVFADKIDAKVMEQSVRGFQTAKKDFASLIAQRIKLNKDDDLFASMFSLANELDVIALKIERYDRMVPSRPSRQNR